MKWINNVHQFAMELNWHAINWIIDLYHYHYDVPCITWLNDYFIDYDLVHCDGSNLRSWNLQCNCCHWWMSLLGWNCIFVINSEMCCCVCTENVWGCVTFTLYISKKRTPLKLQLLCSSSILRLTVFSKSLSANGQWASFSSNYCGLQATI